MPSTDIMIFDPIDALLALDSDPANLLLMLDAYSLDDDLDDPRMLAIFRSCITSDDRFDDLYLDICDRFPLLFDSFDPDDAYSALCMNEPNAF